jgi:hypothetical protein
LEASTDFEASERLSLFVDRVVDFLDEVAVSEGIGTAEEGEAFAAAAKEIRAFQVERVKSDLRDTRVGEFEAAGFSPSQAEFKLIVAERAIDEALKPSRRSETLLPRRVWRAVGKVKVVLSSIKSLSKWLEALDELVGMAGELAKNRLGPKLD